PHPAPVPYTPLFRSAKIRGYEEQLKAALLAKSGIALDYDATPFASRAKLLQDHSTFYVFGCEESYGYLPNDSVRDKDGNAACLIDRKSTRLNSSHVK